MSVNKFSNPVNGIFIRACGTLAREFCETLGVSDHDSDIYWVSYGNVFSFVGGDMFTNAEDMMLAIEHKMTYEEWAEWYWQWTDTDDDGHQLPNRVNLRSWLSGLRPETITDKDSPRSESDGGVEFKEIELDEMTIRSLVEYLSPWISVNERLPEMRERVLMCERNASGQYRTYIDKRVPSGDGWEWAQSINENVVAWMPLPEHPQFDDLQNENL